MCLMFIRTLETPILMEEIKDPKVFHKPYFLTFRKAREEQARLLFRAKETSAQANVKRSRHAWRLQFFDSSDKRYFPKSSECVPSRTNSMISLWSSIHINRKSLSI